MNLYDSLVQLARDEELLIASYRRQGLPVERCACKSLMKVSGVPGGWILRCATCRIVEARSE